MFTPSHASAALRRAAFLAATATAAWVGASNAQTIDPKLPADYENVEFLFLANIHPALQMRVIEKVKTQKGVQLEHAVVEGANHFFDGKVDVLMEQVGAYLDRMVGPEIIKSEQEQV